MNYLRLLNRPGAKMIKDARTTLFNQSVFLTVSSSLAQLDKDDCKIYLDLGANAALIESYSYEELIETIKNGCLTPPVYQHKFSYQIKNSFKYFQQELEAFLKTNEFQILSTTLQNFLKLGLHAIKNWQFLMLNLKNFDSINEYQQLINNFLDFSKF
ncbi:MAG: hypothetical protein REH83_01760 [Rickettsiella sp.]|nr:hypothetical protein [Rickettsiella sp.]